MKRRIKNFRSYGINNQIHAVWNALNEFGGPATCVEISEKIGIQSNTVSNEVKTLVERGWAKLMGSKLQPSRSKRGSGIVTAAAYSAIGDSYEQLVNDYNTTKCFEDVEEDVLANLEPEGDLFEAVVDADPHEDISDSMTISEIRGVYSGLIAAEGRAATELSQACVIADIARKRHSEAADRLAKAKAKMGWLLE